MQKSAGRTSGWTNRTPPRIYHRGKRACYTRATIIRIALSPNSEEQGQGRPLVGLGVESVSQQGGTRARASFSGDTLASGSHTLGRG